MAEKHYDILIIGAGQAGRRAAEGVRSVSQTASIAIIGEELHAPYDRPPLSKEALLQENGAALCDIRTHQSYADDHIDLFLGTRAVSIDRASKKVATDGGDLFGFEKLILATGSRPKLLPVLPYDDELVRSLRTKEDAAVIAGRLRPGALVVIVGAGFIGLEVASAALARGAKPVVIDVADRVLGRVLPRTISERIALAHREAGVELLLGASLGAAKRKADKIEIGVGDRTLSADLVISGVGVTPNVELAEAAGLEVDDGLVVTQTGHTSDPDILGAGEVVRHPVALTNDVLRLESWQVAEKQAYAVGRNAAGVETVYAEPPWFWSDQLGMNIQLVGAFSPQARIIPRISESCGACYFAIDESDGSGRILGAATIDAGADMSVARRLMGRRIDLDALADTNIPLRQIVKSSR
ncbi:MAG: FAD-dependent oxidoreductase [Parvularculaceae bacterium]|nr:FAD-dependent oxidoreductase [Parvularculaceae bacterium]